MHIPWDACDYGEARDYVKSKGMTFGTLNTNLFQTKTTVRDAGKFRFSDSRKDDRGFEALHRRRQNGGRKGCERLDDRRQQHSRAERTSDAPDLECWNRLNAHTGRSATPISAIASNTSFF
jgi:hypothetical protein